MRAGATRTSNPDTICAIGARAPGISSIPCTNDVRTAMELAEWLRRGPHMRQTADILRPWQSMGEPPPPGGEGPKCQDCGWSQWVELGGGDSPDAFHPNLDVRILPGVDIAHDLERLPLPFHDGHAERMKLVHVLNHLTAVAGEALLAECFRILRPGGEIFVMVTDLAFC